MATVEPFQIFDAVPILPKGGGTYPFHELAIGQCLFVAGDSYANSRNHARIATSANYHGLRLQRRFTVRLMDDGVRVWRVA